MAFKGYVVWGEGCLKSMARGALMEKVSLEPRPQGSQEAIHKVNVYKLLRTVFGTREALHKCW